MTLLVTPDTHARRRGARAATGIDPNRWPDIAAVPASWLRGRIARTLVQRVLRDLPLRVVLPDDRVLGGGTISDPVLRLNRPQAFHRRIGSSGLIGFGESYMAGDWDADDLTDVLTVFARRLAVLIPPSLQRLRRAATLRQPLAHLPVRGNARRNVQRHYDLSNEFFAAFLDPTMSYSAALFPYDSEGQPLADRASLPDAQRRKIDRLLDRTGVRPGSQVLEIGTGWGELALRAAGRGAHVTSVTLSELQRELALQRIRAQGLADRVRVELCDYRDVRGSYDAVLSVEMIEAVGHDYWPTYFRTLDARLRSGGRVGLQVITMPHDRMLATRDTYTWIQKYIFPGGLLPSVTAIEETTARHTSLRIVDRLDFGRHYAETLRLWRQAFESHPARIEQLGFDAVFRRMWSLYLAYSEAGFRSGYLDVHQLILDKQELR